MHENSEYSIFQFVQARHYRYTCSHVLHYDKIVQDIHKLTSYSIVVTYSTLHVFIMCHQG